MSPIQPMRDLGFTTEDVRDLPAVPEQESPRFFSEVVPAEFRLFNSLGAYFANEGLDYRVDEDFDSFEAAKGTVLEDFPVALDRVFNRDDFERLRRNVERDLRDREIVASAGTPAALTAGIIAGTVDPIFLLPFGVSTSIFKAGSILEKGLVTARAGFLGSTASEVALQASSDTRTFGEGVLDVSAATLLSGVLGSAGAAVSRAAKGEMAQALARDLDTRVAGGVDVDEIRIASRAVENDLVDDAVDRIVADVTDTELDIKKTLGGVNPGKLGAWLRQPVMWLMVKTHSREARAFTARTFGVPVFTEGNVLGRTAEEGGSVQQRVLLQQHFLGGAAHDMMNRQFIKLRSRLAGKKDPESGAFASMMRRKGLVVRDSITKPPDQWSFRRFDEEVGRAMNRGTDHIVPEVKEAALWFRVKLLEHLRDIRKTGLRDLDDLDDDFIMSYLNRNYRMDLISRDAPEHGEQSFTNLIETWLAEVDPKLTLAERQAEAVAVRSHILGEPDGRVPYEPYTTGRSGTGALKQRKLTMPNERLEPWLDMSILNNYDRYLRTIIPDIELQRTHGTPDFAEAYKPVEDDYLRKLTALRASRKKASDPKTQKKIDTAISKLVKEQKDARFRAEGMWRLLRGRHVGSMSPEDVRARAMEGMMEFNLLTVGGGFGFLSTPDIGKPVMSHGIMRAYGTPIRLFAAQMKGLQGKEISQAIRQEAALIGNAAEMVLNSRAKNLMDVGDHMGRANVLSRGLNVAANNFMILNGLTPWNYAMKSLSSWAGHQRAVKAVRDVAAGTASKSDVEMLALGGITPRLAREMAEQIGRHGRRAGKLQTAGVEAWDGEAAQDLRVAFLSAIKKWNDITIVTPDVGDIQISLRTPLGRLIFQFKQFALASVTRTLIPALQQRDIATMQGIMISAFMGMIVYWARTIEAGREVSDDPTVWVAEGIDRSGLLGLYGDAINIADRLNFGPRAFLGREGSSRYAARNVMGALLGPSFGAAQRALTVGSAAAGELSGLSDFSRSDAKALRRLMPLQNHVILQRYFNAIEEHAAERLPRDR